MPSASLPHGRRRLAIVRSIAQVAERRWASNLLAMLLIVANVVLAAGAGAGRQARTQGQTARTQGQLLRDGIHKMEDYGDYRGAVRDLELASQGRDRQIAARALLYLGDAQEHLGVAEARAAYQKLIREYPDQPLIVARARERLNRLHDPQWRALPGGEIIRRLWGADFTPLGPPSPNGRALPGLNRDGELALRDVTSLEIRRLAALSENEAVTSALLSPDGSQVSSVWWVSGQAGAACEVRVSQVADGRSRTIDHREAEGASVAGWTPDGRGVLVYFAGAKGTGEIDRIEVSSQTSRVVATLPVPVFRSPALSPDGRFIVFTATAFGRSDYDISIVDLATGRVDPLVDHPANDVFPLWTADGRVLFASDRAGRLGLWLADLATGKVQGQPQMVSREIAMLDPAGLAPDGTLYYRREEGLVEVMTSALDLRAGRASVPAPIARRVQGINFFPSWAPDSRRVAYVSRRGQLLLSAGASALVIANTEGGQERDVTVRLKDAGVPRWSPDGRSIAFLTAAAARIDRADVQTGETDTLAAAQGKQGPFPSFEWTPDGQALIYTRESRRVVRRDLRTGREEALYEAQEGRRLLWKLSLSHDGTRVAVGERHENGTELVVAPLTAGPRLTILSRGGSDGMEIAGWSPGDADVFVVTWTAGGPNVPRTLLRVPVDGGPASPTGLVVPTMRDVRVSPDGLRVAFTQGWPTRAIYALTNFLPPPPKAAVRAPARSPIGQ